MRLGEQCQRSSCDRNGHFACRNGEVLRHAGVQGTNSLQWITVAVAVYRADRQSFTIGGPLAAGKSGGRATADYADTG